MWVTRPRPIGPTGVARECPFLACAVERRRFPVGASPTRQSLQPEAIGAVMEETKWLKPSISVSRIGDSASVQAATQVNAEQASKRTMCRPTRLPYRGRLTRLGGMSEAYSQSLHRSIGGSMYTRKAYATRETPRRGQRWPTGRPRGTGRAPWGGGGVRSTDESG